MAVVSSPCVGAVLLEGAFTGPELATLVSDAASYTNTAGPGSVAYTLVGELAGLVDFDDMEPSTWTLQARYTPWAHTLQAGFAPDGAAPAGVLAVETVSSTVLNAIMARGLVHVGSVMEHSGGWPLVTAYVFLANDSPSVYLLPDGAPDPHVTVTTSGSSPPAEIRETPYLDELASLAPVTTIEVAAVAGRVLVVAAFVPRAVAAGSTVRKLATVEILYV